MRRFNFRIVTILFIFQILAACGSSVDLSSPDESGSGISNNILPKSHAGDDQVVEELDESTLEPTTVTLTGSGVDEDGTISGYEWTQTGGSAVIIQSPGTSTIQFSTPEVIDTEELSFSLTVTDNNGGTAVDEVKITVHPHITIARATTSLSEVPELDQYTLEPTVVRMLGASESDKTGNIATFQWKQILETGDIAVVLENADSATPSFNAPEVAVDTILNFELTVTDNPDDTATDTIEIAIINHIVGANAGINQSVSELEASTLMPTKVTLTGSSDTDFYGNVATFEWGQISGPTIMLENASSATPTFEVPEISSTTVLTFMLTAIERGTNTGTDYVDITVKPHVVTASAGDDQVVEEGKTVSLSGNSGADLNGNIATYQWRQIVDVGGISVVLNSANLQEASFVAPIVPMNGEVTLNFEVTVTDNEGDTDKDITSVKVLELNSPPVAEAGMYQYVESDDVGVQLKGSFSRDYETTLITFNWTQVDLSGKTVTLDTANTKNPTFDAPSVTSAITLIFKLQITDKDGTEIATDTVNIAVSPMLPITAANDDSDGNNELSYTKMDENGSPLPQSAVAWSCILDNTTGLIWEVKASEPSDMQYSGNLYSWYQPTVDITGDDIIDDADIVNGSSYDVTTGIVGTEGDATLDVIFDGATITYSSKEQDLDGATCNVLGSCDSESYIVAMNGTHLCATHNNDYVDWANSKWRLPTLAELATIDDISIFTGPQVDGKFLPNMRDDYYWSSETDTVNTLGEIDYFLKALTHTFNDGSDLSFFKLNKDPLIYVDLITSLPVILVRDK